ncbi:prefoldin subunit alpha [Candidatus Woesearchaeota archaeon]|nr:prefoldin subunit alpha [Candidatus Woesearchaeota archaeon]
MAKKEEDTKKAQELQQKYMQLQMFNQQLQQLQKQLETIQNQSAEIQTILLALDDIAKTEIGKEMLVPLSSGIFVRAEIKDNKKLKVNVGSNTIVEKNVQETKALLDRQILELNKLNEDLTSQYSKITAEAEKVQAEVQKMSA